MQKRARCVKSPPFDVKSTRVARETVGVRCKGRVACETVDIRARRARESARPHGTLARFCIENTLAMLHINLFYRKPRSFATTRRHSFSATDGCPSPSVRLSPSAVCLLRIAFRELAFSKSDFRDRVKFRFFPCFSSVACVVSCTRSPYSRRTLRFLAQGRHIPDVLSVFLHFRTFCNRFRRTRLPDLILRLTRPSARLKFASDSPANRYGTPFRKNDFPSDSEAFPTRIFKLLLSHFEFTVYRHFFEKENSNGKSRCFERTLCCKIIIVERLRNDGEIVRTKPEKRTTFHSYSKHSLLRARRSYPLVRPPSFRKPYTFFLFLCFLCAFSAFLCTLSAFFVLSVLSVLFARSYVFLRVCSLFLSPVPAIGSKVGVPERRSAEASEFLMVFRFFRSGFSRCAPPRCCIYKNPSLPCSRNFGGNNFLPRQNTKPA